MFPDIPDELCRMSQKLFVKIMHDLQERAKWLQIYKLVKKHNMVNNSKKSLSRFASEIHMGKVITQLIQDFPNDKFDKLIEEIIDCLIRNGGIVDQGKFVNVVIACNVSFN